MSDLRSGDQNVNAVYYGSTAITKVYSGATLVWEQYVFDGADAAIFNASADNVQTLDVTMENQYKYNSNGAVSQLIHPVGGAGNYAQLWVYYNSDRRAAISYRLFPTGAWQGSFDIHTPMHADAFGDGNHNVFYPANDPNYPNEPALEYDSHNNITIGRCPVSGYLFVCGNQHANYLHMARSESGDHSGPWFNVPRSEFQDAAIPSSHLPALNRATYPVFFQFNNRLWFSVRDLKSGGGVGRYTWYLYSYDSVGDAWELETMFSDALDCRLYLANPVVSSDGTKIGVTGFWRDEVAGGGTANQLEFFYLESTDGVNWYVLNNSGTGTTTVAMPMDFNTTTQVSTVPELIWDTLNGDPIPGSQTLCFDATGTPHIMASAVNGTEYHIRYTASGWVEDVDPGDFARVDASLGSLFRYGTDMARVVDTGDDVLVQVLNPEAHAGYYHGYLIVENYTSDEWSANIDISAANEGWICVGAFINNAPANNSTTVAFASDAFMISIKIQNLESTTFTKP